MFRINYPFKKEILACGAQHHANFCLTTKNFGYIINDLGNLEEMLSWERYQQEIGRLKKELKVKPKIITHDLHPEYNSTKYAQGLTENGKKFKCFAVQHQKAHLASCIGENKLMEKVIGVVLDDSGYGEDENFWGGEFFVGDLQGFKRIAHLKYAPCPRNALNSASDTNQLVMGFLYQSFGEGFIELPIDFIRSRNQSDWQIFKQNLHNPLYSSSAARLLDAVSILIGQKDRIEYEGQGVIELERIINRSSHVANRSYEFTVKQNKDMFLIHLEPIFKSIVEDIKRKTSKSIISAIFHNTITEIIRQLCHKIRQRKKVETVVLTGSVFQNKTLFNRVKDLLSQDDFKVVEHKHFSCNDSNISFGQAVLANAKR